MESINNMAQAAARAVWGTGQSTEEPVSGETGNTAKGEPYDAGNMEPRSANLESGSVKPTEFTSTTGEEDTAGGNNYTTSSENFRTTTGSSYLPTRDSEYNKPASELGTGTASTDIKSSETASESKPASAEARETAGSTYLPTRDKGTKSSTDDTTTAEKDTTATTSSSGPHKEFASSIKPNEVMSKAQQDVRDPSDPQTDLKNTQAKDNVDDTTEGLDNPTKMDGTGPRLIEEVAKQYGGDAGNAKPAGKRDTDAQDEDEGDGPQKTSHGSGTGEQYVKSSGLQADGGDFDATKPGAGREADRLLEQKGIHKEGNNKSKAMTDDDAHDSHVASGHEEKEKKSLGEKIKAKLHKPHLKHKNES